MFSINKKCCHILILRNYKKFNSKAKKYLISIFLYKKKYGNYILEKKVKIIYKKLK